MFRLKKSSKCAITDWIADKERSKFAFEAMCWAKSHIPLAVWKAGEPTSNLVEIVHADINREGVACTLVGGVLKGQRFDVYKLKSLQVSVIISSYDVLTKRHQQAYEAAGITPSYGSGHLYESAVKNLKRKSKFKL